MRKKSGCLRLLLILLAIVGAIVLAGYIFYTYMISPQINGLTLTELRQIYTELQQPVDEADILSNEPTELDYSSVVSKFTGANLNIFDEQDNLDEAALNSLTAEDLSLAVTLTDAEVASLLNEFVKVEDSEGINISAFFVKEVVIEEENGVITFSVIAKVDAQNLTDEDGYLLNFIPEDIYIKVETSIELQESEYVVTSGDIKIINLSTESNDLLMGAIADFADNVSQDDIDVTYLDELLGNEVVGFVNNLQTNDGLTVTFADGSVTVVPAY